MKNFQKLLELYMRVNGVSRAEMAEQIGIPKNALRRVMEGKSIKGEEVLQIMVWTFDQGDEE